jgi:peptidyl-prolyl cis-trans isomerase B (cyclophilin B)
MRITILAFTCLLFAACSSTNKPFRNLNKNETAAFKAAKKQWGKQTDAYRVLIITDSGNMVVRLYNQTPLHRDNFISKVKAGFYDSLLFHRVIKNFMIQGGDPQSKLAKPGQELGDGEAPGGRIPAEIRTNAGIYHKKGVIAAARDDNPEKASSNCQFYIAQGKKFSNAQLDSAAAKRGYKLSEAQRLLYTSTGGIPHLDGNYTVFGELESGTDVLDKIAAVKTSPADRPLGDVRMFMFVLNTLKK